MTDLLLLALAAAFGPVLARARLCFVAAAQELVTSGRVDGFLAKATAGAASGLVLVGLAATGLAHPMLAGSDAAPMTLVVAALALALGALVNGGCYLGSLTYVGSGRADFVFTFVGIALAGRYDPVRAWGLLAHGVAGDAPAGPARLALVGVFAITLSLTALAARRRLAREGMTRFTLALATGLVAGLLMSRAPGWSYASAFTSFGRFGLAPVAWSAVLAPLVLLGSTLAANILTGTWSPTAPTLLGSTRCLAGGYLMECAAHAIPGGSDTLVLWAMPGLGGYGFLAYGVAIAGLVGAFWIRRLAAGPRHAGSSAR